MVLNTVISATAGGIVGGIVTYITVKKTFDQRTLEAVEDVKKRYALLRKEPDAVASVLGQDIDQAAEAVSVDIHVTADDVQIFTEDEIRSGGLSDVPKPVEGGHLQYHNVTPSVESDEPEEPKQVDGMPIGNLWEQGFNASPGAEIMADAYVREEGKPFIISVDEVSEAHDKGHETLVYYEGDGTLATYPGNSIILDIDRVIGARHLAMFGVKSGDPLTVYIQNDSLGMVYEVNHESASYNKKVLGLDEEFTGDAEPKRRPGRMRNDE